MKDAGVDRAPTAISFSVGAGRPRDEDLAGDQGLAGGSKDNPWRARIGVIQPTHLGRQFAVWYRTAPPDVDIVPTIIGFRSGHAAGFAKSFARMEQLARELGEVGCDLISISGAPPFLQRGREFEREWAADITRQTGCQVVTAVEPHAVALSVLGARRVAVATYFGDDLNRAITKHLAHFGIETVMLGGFRRSKEDEGLFSTPLLDMPRVTPQEVHRYCVERLREAGPIDALYISGGGWNAAPAIEPLERELGLPVVWALAAEIWLVYQKLGIDHHVAGLGRILSEGYRIEPAEPRMEQ